MELKTQLRADTGGVREDRRRFPRTKVRLHVTTVCVPETHMSDTCYQDHEMEAMNGLVTDISPAGLHLVSKYGYERDTELWIALPIPAVADAEDVEGQVVVRGIVTRRSKEVSQGRAAFFHGVQFLRSDKAADAVAAIVAYIAQV